MTARPGRIPASVMSLTSDATSARISAAILLPSRIVAAMNLRLPFGKQKFIVNHRGQKSFNREGRKESR